MTTAGEAASLFGGADSGDDPFSLTAQDLQQTSGNDPFADLGPADGAPDPFDFSSHSTAETTDHENYFAHDTPGYEAQGAAWGSSSTPDYAHGVPQSQYSQPREETYPSYPAGNGWSHAQEQWTGHDSQQHHAANGAYTDTAYSVNTQSYAPYAASAYTSPPIPQAPSADTHSYASYAPPTNSYSSYAPESTPLQTSYDSSYDPYRPQSALTKPAPPSQSVSQYNPYPVYSATPSYTTDAAIPSIPQPAPRSTTSAAVYRPKTFNAYDPPLPPPKPAAKRPPAFQSPLGSPAVASYALGPGSPPSSRSSQTTPLPPPPPRKASLPPPPTRTGPPLRPSTASPAPPAPGSVYTSPKHLPPPRSGLPPPSATSSAFVKPPPPPASLYSSPASHPEPSSWSAPPPAEHPSSREQPHAESPSDDFWARVGDHAADEGLHAVPVVANEVPDAHAPFETLTREQGYLNEQQHEQSSVSLHATHAIEAGASLGAHNEAIEGYDHEGAVDFETQEPEATIQHTVHHDATPSIGLPLSSQTNPAYEPYHPRAAGSQPQPYESQAANHTSPVVPSPWTSPDRRSMDQHHPPTSPPKPVPSTRSSIDSYRPHLNQMHEPAMTRRAASPSSFSMKSTHSTQSREGSLRDPYAPPDPSTSFVGARYRSMSNGSAFSFNAANEDPYAPAHHSRQQSFESLSHGAFSVPHTLAEETSTPPISAAQVLTLSAATRAPYAPSPSLLGSNDPLGRTAVRVPLVTFGFGGQMITCFHGSSTLHTGFDIAMSSRASGILHLRSLQSVIPQSAIDTSTAAFPGPLFADPGTPATTLVRTGASTQVKAKKAKVIQYLDERAEELSRGIGYLHHGSVEGFKAEAKRVLISLLKVMVENDGRLSGSQQIDAAVRAALLPDIQPSSDSPSEKLTTPATVGFAHHVSGYDMPSTSYGAPSHHAHDLKNVKLADHPLWSSQLDKIERFLVRGDRRGAYHYAADEKLWAHALLIASSVDKEAWKEVVTEFIRSELSTASTPGQSGNQKQSDGREPLRLAYSMFAGQGAASVQELHPAKPLGSNVAALAVIPVPVPTAATPMSASFAPPVAPVSLPAETLAKWAQTAALIISSTMTAESSSTLTALGDHLAANNWIEAAHACYLLSPLTSLVGGAGMPGARVVLYGSPSPLVTPSIVKDPDATIFTEIVEFALSLAPVTKGQEAFSGLPHLQPYRLLRACNLAELGHVELANRYCEAISNSLSRNSPYLNATFGEQLRSLSDRLVAAPLFDKSGSWIGAKMTRPSLDKLGNWLEGRFTSWMVGEGDSPKAENPTGKVPTFSGPFAHYSTISSATSSNIPSPQMSASNLAQGHPQAAPLRTGSAMALRPPSASHAQIARASSAIDYLRRKPSPVPRVSSASAATFTELPSRSHGQVPYGYMNGVEASANVDKADLRTPTIQEDTMDRPPAPQIGSWWSSLESDTTTPTATSFTDASFEPSSDGFISLMDDPALSAPSSSSTARFSATPRLASSRQHDFDEEDDLGLGNMSISKKTGPAEEEERKPASAAAPPPEKPKEADKTANAPSSGWLSRLWKRSDSAPGPVKANLGEESSFYYDAEQKRWVNKNAPPEAAKPAAPPPPPSRAQTASPGMSSARAPTVPSPGPPPARPATAIDLTDGPPKRPPTRVRSNLVPPDAPPTPKTPSSAAPSRPSSTVSTMSDGPPGLDGPPLPGARAKAPAKRNARSRYVDVFQQEAST